MAQSSQPQNTGRAAPRAAARHPAAANLPDLDQQPTTAAAPAASPAPSTNVGRVQEAPSFAPAPQQAVESQRPAATVPQPPAPAVPQQPAWDPAAWQAEQHARQAQAQRDHEAKVAEYERRIAESAAELEAARSQIAEFKQAQRSLDINALTEVDLGELEFLDEEAAREIRERILTPVVSRVLQEAENRINSVGETAQAALKANESSMAQWEQQRQQSRLTELNRAIYATHPDLDQIIQSPEYAAFMQETIPGTMVTRGSQIAAAYQAGQADFVNGMINQFKSASPSIEQFAAPAPQAHAGQLTPAAPTTQYTYDDLAKHRQLRDGRHITHEEYNQFLSDFNQAEAEGRVGYSTAGML